MKSIPIIALALALGGGFVSAQAQPKARAKAPAGLTTPASIQELMRSVINPSVNVLWSPPPSIADPEKTKAPQAQIDEDWQSLRRAAIALSEVPNLLVIPGRRAADPTAKMQDEGQQGNLSRQQIEKAIRANPAQFRAFARNLQVTALATLAAVDKKSPDGLLEAGGRIDEACEACHKVFWYPNAK